jgi:DNA recombination-dependent growth factor C
MPIMRGAVTFSRFRVEPVGARPKDEKAWITKGLRTRAFEPIDRKGQDDRAAGFVELEDRDATEFAVGNLFRGEYALFAFRLDRIKVPSAAVRAELEKWERAFAGENGRPPGRREKAEMRGQIQHELRARATPNSKVFDVSWNLEANQLQIWAATRKVVEEIHALLEQSFQITLVGAVPTALAQRHGIDDAKLGPTPELCWPGYDQEASNG